MRIPSTGAEAVKTSMADRALLQRYREVRRRSEALAAPLAPEDQVVQIASFASPTKWHMAHTTWFFENFILCEALPNYRPFHPAYRDFFNSYYNAVGDQVQQGVRGYYSRPTTGEVAEYRQYVDGHMIDFLEGRDETELGEWASVIILGMHHEEQHQELLVTDIKYALAHNPLRPAYRGEAATPGETATAPELVWRAFDEGIHRMGYEGDGFAFDNETPRHRVFLEPFQLGSRPVINSEYLHFIEDGGYRRSDLWLSLGWTAVEQNRWSSPLYWEKLDGRWQNYTLAGMQELDPSAPVCHVSYFEADAYARWAGARLATEAEWELASTESSLEGNFMESGLLRPRTVVPRQDEGLSQMFGDVWEWTASSHAPYPGYRPNEGALGEYNGKFMCNQYVLRGGSCATPRDHIRRSYRNFFPPELRWQFMGIRLAKDLR